MKDIIYFLKGRKTYIISACIVAIALLRAYLEGNLSFEELIVILNGVGLGTLRAGVSKSATF
jgi:hypothetical protein